jgi:hypothetical protein
VIPLLLMLADAPAMTPVEAERAFAADAKKIGQWTAFRKWSADDAVMFVPQETNAHAFLKDRQDPKEAIDWWPTASWISCDGSIAVNHGGWKRPDGSVGYFSTVWRRQPDGAWKWIVDGGDSLKVALSRPAEVKVVRGDCARKAPPLGKITSGGGAASDRTILWEWTYNTSGNIRVFNAFQWTGKGYVQVVDDLIDNK